MPRGHARYVLAIMVVINLLNYADRWIAAAVAPLIQAEFRLLDFQVGLLGSAFLVVYAVSALAFGYWADRGVRRTVIGVGVTIWSVATVAFGFVQSYTQLFLTRTVLGLGEASYYPAGGTVLGGWLADRFSGRTQRAYLMVGIAGFVLASGTITLALVLPLSVAGVPVFVSLFFVSVVLVYLYSGPFTAISQNVVTPGLRAGAVTWIAKPIVLRTALTNRSQPEESVQALSGLQPFSRSSPAFLSRWRLGLPAHRWPPGWALIAGALLGAGGHFAQVLSDIPADRRRGVRGLPQLVGQSRSAVAAALLLLAATAAVTFGPGRPHLLPIVAMSLSVLSALGVVAATASGHHPRLAFRLTLAVAAIAVLEFLAEGRSL